MKYKINREKCTGCGSCKEICPFGIKLDREEKAEIINEEELEKQGGEKVCPFEAIEKDGEN